MRDPSATDRSVPTSPMDTPLPYQPTTDYMLRKVHELRREQRDICWRPSADWRNVCIKPLAHHSQCGWDDAMERYTAALWEIGTDCRYESDERRCCSNEYLTDREEWCAGCVAWFALTNGDAGAHDVATDEPGHAPADVLQPGEPNRMSDAEVEWVQIEGTSWPVDHGVEWVLRYGNSDLLEQHRMSAASVISAYAALTDSNITQADAIRSLKRARAAAKGNRGSRTE